MPPRAGARPDTEANIGRTAHVTVDPRERDLEFRIAISAERYRQWTNLATGNLDLASDAWHLWSHCREREALDLLIEGGAA